MKELKDTVELMLSDNWQDRLKAEIYQCQIRREALSSFMTRVNKDDPEFEMLNSQLVHMIDYEVDLTNRASAFGIELESIDETENRELNAWWEQVKQSNYCCCNYTPPGSPFDFASFMLGSLFGMELGKDGDKK